MSEGRGRGILRRGGGVTGGDRGDDPPPQLLVRPDRKPKAQSSPDAPRTSRSASNNRDKRYEKVPPLILKPKDRDARSQSPAPDVSQLIKIAIASRQRPLVIASQAQAPPSPRSKPNTVQKLQLEWQSPFANPIRIVSDRCSFVHDPVLDTLGNSSGYVVIGALSLAGVDKEKCLNLFVPETIRSKAFTRIRSDGRNTTSGLAELYAAGGRCLLVNSQGLRSVSYADRNTESRAPVRGLELLSVQTVSFMLSICHVLLLVSEWPADDSLQKMVRACMRVRPKLPDELAPSSTGPEIVSVYLRTPDHFFITPVMRRLQHMSYMALNNSQLTHRDSVTMRSFASRDSNALDFGATKAQADSSKTVADVSKHTGSSANSNKNEALSNGSNMNAKPSNRATGDTNAAVLSAGNITNDTIESVQSTEHISDAVLARENVFMLPCGPGDTKSDELQRSVPVQYSQYGESLSVAHDGFDSITSELTRKVNALPRSAARPKIGMQEWIRHVSNIVDNTRHIFDFTPRDRDREPQRTHGDREPQRTLGDRDPQRTHGDREAQRTHVDREPQRTHGDREAHRTHGDREPQRTHGDREPQRTYGRRR